MNGNVRTLICLADTAHNDIMSDALSGSTQYIQLADRHRTAIKCNFSAMTQTIFYQESIDLVAKKSTYKRIDNKMLRNNIKTLPKPPDSY